MGKIFRAPVLLLDAPFLRERTPDDHCLKYVVSQLKEVVSWLEQKTGRKFDIDRLREVMGLSTEGCRLWNDALDQARYKPAPWTAFDEYIHMAAIVTHRGTSECVDYYKQINEFLAKRAAAQFAAVPSEAYRFYWDNIPMWFRLRGQYELLASYKISILASLYVHSWTYEFDLKDPFKSLAENYLSVFCNTSIENRTRLILELFQRYDLNGYVFHSNRSCKAATFGAFDIMRNIQEITGIPGLEFEADMGDPRSFAEEQFRIKLEGYLDLLNGR
jgi:benzoyl-CoA reductase/2-hydroxyglutaryl-CoA dehydratase subunit BcrC/BadD/HgdB